MAKSRDEDLFAGTSMSFGEHLEELRTALIRALLGLAVGFLIGLAVGKHVVEIIKSPLERGLATYYKEGSILQYTAFVKDREKDGLPVPYTLKQVEHLVNQKRLVFTMYQVHPSAVRTTLGIDQGVKAPENAREGAKLTPGATSAGEATELPDKGGAKPPADDAQAKDPTAPPVEIEPLTPLFVWQPVANDERASIKGLSVQEVFMFWLKASLMAGVVFSSPWIFYQLWSFVAAGLYPNEKRFVRIFLPISVVLFLTGAAFCFFIVFNFVLDYLFTYNRTMGISPDPRINEWMGFAIFLPIGFGLSFQLPLVMLFLNRIGVMSVQNYLAKWRISVLVIFVVAMVLTPADPISMLAMALPLTALYFGGILICHWSGPRKNPLET